MNENKEGRNGNTALLTVLGICTLLVALVGATFAFFTATTNNTNNQSVVVKTSAPASLEYTNVDGALELSNAKPGDDATTKTFTVKNPSEAEASTAGKDAIDMQYSLSLEIVENQFTDSLSGQEGHTNAGEQLKLTISGTGTSTMKVNSARATGEASTGFTVSEGKTVFNLTDGDGKTTEGATGTENGSFDGGKSIEFVTNQPITVGETQTYTADLSFLETNENQDENQGASFSAHIDIKDVSTFVPSN